ncbi:hypothetical protein [Agromyces larvae]|uniref:DUF5047 domain-containing protein n=1 Tax=Agromyces larvae TaxID=2929802 RepID=A0ABY4C4W5_9MICO|nr:hypothetical protein [Agromyces larvae]UOE45467.1 hypothetical protein MTO99_06840 [Agromyces larvae]
MFDEVDEVRAALIDSNVESYVVAQAQYQGRTALLNVVPDGDLTWDADGEIQASGSLRVVGFGDELLPRSRDALLAPFGQEVTVSRVVRLRNAEATIPLGVFRIIGNDGGRRSLRDGRVLDWEVGVDLADRFRMLQRGKIVDPASPPTGASMWSELQRLALFPLLRSVEDVPVPAGMVYDDRISAVHNLAALVNGRPRLTRQGALTVLPADRWLTESVPEFDIDGTISWDESQSDEFFNFVWAHSDDGQFSAFAVLDDDSDPRSVGRAGPSTYEHSSPVYTSQSAAQEGAQTILTRLVNRRSRTVTVEVGAIGLLLDLSDFGWVRDPVQGKAVLGEVRGIRVPNDPTEPIRLELIVAEVA